MLVNKRSTSTGDNHYLLTCTIASFHWEGRVAPIRIVWWYPPFFIEVSVTIQVKWAVMYSRVMVFNLASFFVCLHTYEFWLSLWKIVRNSVILLLPLFTILLLDFINVPPVWPRFCIKNNMVGAIMWSTDF